MNLRELASAVDIDPRKLTEYALNPEHPEGQHKAYLFRTVLGYSQENSQELLIQLESQALDSEAVVRVTDEYGQRVQVDLDVRGAAGQEATVRTGWIIPPNGNRARLVSLYVKEV